VDFPAGMAGLWEETQPTNILIKIDHRFTGSSIPSAVIYRVTPPTFQVPPVL